MKITVLALSLILTALIALGGQVEEIPGKAISIESLVEMFQNIEGNTDWDTTKNLLWGYFFTHNEPERLEKASRTLGEKGYRIVNIYLSDKDDPNEPDKYWLHIEKAETHTPESLDKRNNEFYIFAHELGLDSYDGMDVGPVAQ